MPYTRIILKPGTNTQDTPLLNEAGWSQTNLVRFFQGLLQKIGGWQRLISTRLTGICRGIFAWADLTGVPYIACGTEQRLQVVAAGVLYDITPIRVTHNVTPQYSTTSGLTTVTVTDVAHGASAGDGVDILNPISVGGIILQGDYAIASVVDADHYTITAASPATATVAAAGAAASFATINTSATVTVTLNNHGLSVGSVYTVFVSTAVGGVTLFQDFVVQAPVITNSFAITAPTNATSTTTDSENGGNSRLQYLLPTGNVSAGTAMGYGAGPYGLGPYGVGGTSGSITPPREWSLDAWGQQLLASPNYGALYVWDPSAGVFENPATVISAAPAQQTGFFVAMPEQQVVSYGATDPGTGAIDPMLIRWCDVANYNDWTATAINQAGSFRLPRGSKIVGGIQGPNYGLLWTDLALWAQQYVQPPLVYGFNEIASGCGLLSLRARCILGTDVVWASQSNFFSYAGGGVQVLPCPVWDQVFGPNGLNTFQAEKAFLGGDTPFNEFFMFYPSLGGSGENDSYVKSTKDGNWDYGSLVRTAWTDQSVVGNPLGVDGNGLIQQHETGFDADGSPIQSSATSGWFKLNDGQLFIFIERMIPDFLLLNGATVSLTVYTADYPDATPDIYGPFEVTNETNYIIIRSRSRLARIQISGDADLGTFWRLGEMIYMATPSGRR